MKEVEVRLPGDDAELKCIADIGVGGERGMIFSFDSICPCQSATQYKDAIKVVVIEEE